MQVSAKLKHSVNLGEEVNVVKGAKWERIAANDAKQQAKMERDEAKYNVGMERARKGIFRKGNKERLESYELEM